MDHHVDDDGRAKNGGDGADADLRGGEGRARDEVAEKAEYAAAQKAGRKHDQGLCRMKERFHEMRDGDADKGDGAGEGRHAGGKDA